MTEQNSTFTVILAGRVIQVKKPTSGQVEAMIRIATALRTGTEDDPNDFWIRHIQRLGKLLDSLVVEGDLDTVDDLYLTGKISSTELLQSILAATREEKEKAPKTGPVKRVRSK